MDKNTLSNYGWIVIAVLVLSVMIALATPFGEYIKAGVESTTAGLFDTSEKALNVVGMSAKEQPKNLFEGYSWKFEAPSYAHSSEMYLSTDTGISLGKTYVLQCEFSTNDNKGLSVKFWGTKDVVKIEGFKYSTLNTFVFTVPEDDRIVYMCFSFYHNNGTEEMLIPSKTELYDLEKLQQLGYENAGKTILAFGDSITANSTAYRSYAYQIADNNYMNLINQAVSGATARVVDGNSNNVLEQVTNADASLSPDVILLNILTNDANSFSVTGGTISEDFDAELDTSTFCGGLEATIKAIKEKWPDANILFVTPHVNGARSSTAQEMTVEATLEICEKWGTPVADVYHDSGLNTFDETQASTYSLDKCHPNTLGHKTFYVPIVEAKMKELCK